MALDTAQERGSAIGISLPWRTWTAEPDGVLEFGDRVGLLYSLGVYQGDITQVDGYRVPDGRPHYSLTDQRPHYRVIE